MCACVWACVCLCVCVCVCARVYACFHFIYLGVGPTRVCFNVKLIHLFSTDSLLILIMLSNFKYDFQLCDLNRVMQVVYIIHVIVEH